MHNDFIIRVATTEDLSALVKVGSRLFDNKIKPHRAKEFLEDPRHHMLLAYNNGKIVGMVSALHYVHPDKDPQLFINEVRVVDDFQNKTIGGDLVRFMSQHGRQLGCTQTWSESKASNQTALNSYTAAGGIENVEPNLIFNFEKEN